MTRVLISADLHYRPPDRPVYLEFARWVQAQQPDCFILAGDVGHPLRLFRRGLQLFRRLDCPKLLIAGNHDVYASDYDSQTLWQTVLPQVAVDEGFIWLEDEAYTLPLATRCTPPALGLSGGSVTSATGEARPVGQRPFPGTGYKAGKYGTVSSGAGAIAAATLPESTLTDDARSTDPPHPLTPFPAAQQLGICGTMAWYDYSSRTPHVGYSDKEYRAMKGLVNHDADYVDWPWSDRAMARYLIKGFASRLAQLQGNPLVHQILVVTHVPPFRSAVPVCVESASFSLLSAYLGNFTLGQILRQAPKVTHVVSGHLHRPGRWTVPGMHGPIDFRLVGSDKGSPTAVVLTF